ncbi:hypothetical protein RhiirA4_548671 [Rhizophagus irregularis]|uniref:TLDc domain-containing protein n=1 Tax=Rhizophagus irregularis TaxID=588596 RepID=A0A2I1H8W3_9GLOM|nr:hypothetical protein RhiirA4_548671 [Rhizophagus irregularis]
MKLKYPYAVLAYDLEVTDKLQLMIAADVLMLDHLINFLDDLICREIDYVNKYTSEVLLTVIQILGCKELLKICEKKLLLQPKNLFYFEEFLSIPQIPYDFHILYRCPGTKLTETGWCKYVYNQGPTLTVIKIKDDSVPLIFGGYRNISWSEENNENGIGGDGFTFYSYDINGYIKFRWVDKHLALNMHLGSRNNSYDFRRGKSIYIDEIYTIDTFEVFKVVKKEDL